MKALTRGQMATLLVVALRFKREHAETDVAKFQPMLDSGIEKLTEALGPYGHDRLTGEMRDEQPATDACEAAPDTV